MARLYEESQTPEWMKPLKKLHQRRKSEQEEKEEAERRKAEEERQRFEALPAWKKQLIYKKRAKSAENLLVGSSIKNIDKSQTEHLGNANNTECKAKENTENDGEVEVEPETKFNVTNDCDEDGTSNDKPEDEDTVDDEVKASGEEREDEDDKQNGAVEDSTADDEQPVELNESENKNIEVADVDGSVNSYAEDQNSEENENDNNDRPTELLNNTSEGEINEDDPREQEDESKCIEGNDKEAEEQRQEENIESAVEKVNNNGE